MANKFDYYNIIGLTPKASPDDIKNAFRENAKRYHPDINKTPGAEEIFKRINDAYQVLSDPIKREQYDAVNREIKEKAERIRREEWIRQGTENKIPISDDIWETLKHNIRPLVILAIIWVIFVVMPINIEDTYAIVQAELYRVPTQIPTPVVSNDYIFDIDRGAGIILYKKGDCIITAMVDTNVNEESGICAGNDWDSFRKEIKKIKPIAKTSIPTPIPTPAPIPVSTSISTTSIDPKASVILANIDPDIREHISSVNILDIGKIQDICRRFGSSVGCVIMSGKGRRIITADIYLLDNYDNTCYTFEYALYHEIGHVVVVHNYGIAAIHREDLADNYAGQYIYNEC